MKIVLDIDLKTANLIKKDGKIISSYPFKSLLKKNISFDELNSELERFNKFLENKPELDDIQDLLPYVNAFDFKL